MNCVEGGKDWQSDYNQRLAKWSPFRPANTLDLEKLSARVDRLEAELQRTRSAHTLTSETIEVLREENEALRNENAALRAHPWIERRENGSIWKYEIVRDGFVPLTETLESTPDPRSSILSRAMKAHNT